MYLQTTLVCALLAAIAEAGPLGSFIRGEGAPRYHLARRKDTEPSSSKVLGEALTTTVVTVVPGQLLSDTATPPASTVPKDIPESSLSLSSTLTLPITSPLSPSSTLTSSTAIRTSPPENTKAPISSSEASPPARSSPVAEIPTIVTDVPSPTSTVTPSEFAENVAQAKELNNLFSTLTGQSACDPGQAACIDGSLAFCSNGKTFDILPCPSGTGCYALPMTTTEGVGLGCVSKAAAEDLLGSDNPPAPSAAPSSSDGIFTRTATITQSSGAVTLTLTVDPNRPADATGTPAITPSPSSTASSRGARPTTTSDVLEVIPINDDEPTTTLTTTLTQTSATTSTVPAAVVTPEPSGVPDAGGEVPPPSTRTRRRRPRPTPTESAAPEGGNGGAQPQPTLPPPGNPDRSGPGDDTRVTFTLVETVTETVGTVTEKETVTERETVTVTASAVREAGTVVVI